MTSNGLELKYKEQINNKEDKNQDNLKEFTLDNWD
jgi:hypothetical protein